VDKVLRTDKELLKEPVTVREGNRQRKISKHDAMLLRIVNEAVSGSLQFEGLKAE
jgi:hypothetical protein